MKNMINLNIFKVIKLMAMVVAFASFHQANAGNPVNITCSALMLSWVSDSGIVDGQRYEEAGNYYRDPADQFSSDDYELTRFTCYSGSDVCGPYVVVIHSKDQPDEAPIFETKNLHGVSWTKYVPVK